MKKYLRLISSLIPSVFLYSCDSGDPSASNSLDLTGPGKITLSNYADITYDALYAADSFNNHIASSIVQSIQETNNQTKLSPYSLSSTTSTASGKAIGTETTACFGGGSRTLSITNSSILWAYNDCELGVFPEKLVGSLTLDNYSGDYLDTPQPCPSSFSASLIYTDLGIASTDLSTTSVVNGIGNLTLNSNAFAGSTTCDKMTINYTNLEIGITQNSFSVANYKDFNFTKIFNPLDGNYSNTYQGELGLISAQGRIDAEITAPNSLNGNELNDHPDSGKIILTDGTATLTITINSKVSDNPIAITIGLDSDTDGIFDAGFPVNYSWDELDTI